MRHIYLAVLLTMSAFSSCEKIDFSTSMQEKSNTDNVKNTETTSENTTVNSDTHVVILREILSEDKVNVMYVSLNEWGDMTSTYSNDAGEGAQNIASAYQEGDMHTWHIPTQAEVQRIKAYYDANPTQLDLLNQQLESLGACPVCTEDYSGNTYRYLCSRGDSTFTLRKGYATLKAGATVKYHLRLVKDSIQDIIPSEIHFEY